MSADVFSRVVFPRLRDVDADDMRERERLRGYADGHAEGFRVGAAQAAAEAARAETARAMSEASMRRSIASAVAALQTAADALTARAGELTSASEQHISARAIDLAEMIIADALSDPAFAAVTALRRALAAHDSRDVRSIRLSPADVRTLTEQGALSDELAVTVDETLDPGDAMIDVDDGFVDARISAALRRARSTVGDAP